ncbi:hypothetical protein AT251_21640 [Enterovibrio nigricans]|uniref:Uncharacterized protein n=1 Tax=Enterovibrio nigricans DSM 22720 TaxID=1121868 RepID=A0A1T4W1L7_9GAMM|nr:hypothetical protein AT251_21640 [Enterovibrio nigricans]SKA70621.1 hypothetical protein SAMN02745132_04595 [Enterovibrio nigricans DSM 22720]
MTSPLMKSTLADRDTLYERDQPLKGLAYVSNHWDPLLHAQTAFFEDVLDVAKAQWIGKVIADGLKDDGAWVLLAFEAERHRWHLKKYSLPPISKYLRANFATLPFQLS